MLHAVVEGSFLCIGVLEMVTVKVEIFALHLFSRFSRSNLAARKQKRANMFILCNRSM